MKPFAALIAPQHRYLYLALFANCIVIGIEMTIIGATLPKMLTQFSWSYTVAGAIIAAGSFGDFISSYISGILIDWIGPKAVILAGIILQGFALAFFAAIPSVLLNFILSMFIGFGQGGVDVTINYSVARMQKPKESRPMGIIHSAYALGSVVGPGITGMVIYAGFPWQLIFRAVAGITFFIGLIMLTLPFDRIQDISDQSITDPASGRPSRHMMYYLAALILFLYVGLEFGASRWISEYFVAIFGTNITIGAAMAGIFWIAIFLGRIIVPIFFQKVDQSFLLIGLSLFATGSLAVSLLAQSPISAAICFFAAGLGCSAIYPLVITMTGQYFRESQGKAIGFAATGGAMGALVFPLIMSAVSESHGLSTGFWVYVIIGCLMSAAAVMIKPVVRRKSLRLHHE